MAAFSSVAWGEDLTLAWDANSEENLAGYKLYYKSNTSGAPYNGTGLNEDDSPIIIYLEAPADADASTHVLEDPASPAFSLTGLADGNTYYFALTAFDVDNLESDYSDEISYVTSGATTYSITASATGQGGISPEGMVSVSEGDSQTFIIEPGPNYHLAGVTVDGNSVGMVSSYTFENVSASHTISALFEIDTFTITATAGENGSISSQGVTSVSYGTNRTYTITPADGYHIANVLVDGDSVGQASSYTFQNISTWHTIAATFEADSDGGIVVDDPVDDAGDASDTPADGGDKTDDDGTTDPTKQISANQAPDVPAPVVENFTASGVGPVILSLTAFSDQDSDDTHLKTQWRVFRSDDGVCVFDIASTSSLTEFSVPEIMLDEYMNYYWTARFFDSNYSASDWSEAACFSTGGSDSDTDGNGIPDAQEVDSSVDMNQDSVPDAEQEIVKSIVLPESEQTIGMNIEDSDTAMSILYMESVSIDDLGISDADKTRAGMLPFGLINFKISVAEPGDTAIITVLFSEPVSDDAKWMKLDVVNGIWLDYSGYAQLSEDGLSMSLEIVDGGFGDDDGVANGIIVDPAGLELAVADDVVSTGSGNTDSGLVDGCFITAASGEELTDRPKAAAALFILVGVVAMMGRSRKSTS